MMNAIAGLANAWSNCWPMMLIGGSSDLSQNGMGAFQEAPQVEAARPWCKYAAQVDRVERIPFFVEQAVRTSIYGRPGAVYLDLPGDIIDGVIDEDAVRMPPRVPDAPRPGTDPASIERALAVLAKAERPLVIVGKGVAYARAEAEVRQFIEATQLPFLPSPMGKGVMPDDHPLSVSAARSFALQNADVVMLMGAGSTGSCTSACRRASTRTCRSSRSTSRRRRSARTSRPRSRSSATRARSWRS